MSYLVIARKYRPLTFEDVIGQEHVTKTMINAINLNKVHHAYLLTGPRGVGKTTVSRILAKALNCETGITPQPCGVCKNCKEIDQGFSLDVKEIDGASNRGIDEIRDLRDDIKFAPASCRKKIYIIDEVHMLTNQAFNALLKTLEEPPDHAIFIFATTEVNEVPATILSRCQRHDFKRVANSILVDLLKKICDSENVTIDDESLLLIARSGDGSVRDSESVLDQVIAYCGNEINIDKASEALGIPKTEIYFNLLDIVKKKDTGKLINYIEDLNSSGIHFISYIKGLIEFFRSMLILKTTGDEGLLDLTSDSIKKMKSYISIYNDKDLLLFLDLLSKGNSKLKTSPFQRIDFEIILLKILHYEPISKIDDILIKLASTDIDLSEVNNIINEQKPIKEKIDIDNEIEPEVKKKTEVEEITAEIPEPISTTEKTSSTQDKTSSESISIDEIMDKWKDFIAFLTDSNPNIGNMLVYGIPDTFTDDILEIKFDRKHKIHRNLCERKIKNINKELKLFFENKNIKLSIIEGQVNNSDRIIKINEEKKKKSQEEMKEELLKLSPELKFLFDDPFNCKFIE